MKKKDLVIGDKYITTGRYFTTTTILEGFDQDGDPVLRPLDDCPYKLYDEQAEKNDPVCKIGSYGLFLDDFLISFSKVL